MIKHALIAAIILVNVSTNTQDQVTKIHVIIIMKNYRIHVKIIQIHARRELILMHLLVGLLVGFLG